MMQCKYCDSKNVKKFKKINSVRSSDKYNLYSCLACNSRFFNEAEHEFDVGSFYDDDFLDDILHIRIHLGKAFIGPRKFEKL
jgi:hypothetical protein